MAESASHHPQTGAGDPDCRHRTSLVTLLFTDMVGSTALKQRLGDRASSAFFDRHHQIVRQTLFLFASGLEIETAGDSFLITFDTPSDAVKFALLLQSRLRALSLEQNAGALDRIGIHVGEVVIKTDQPTAKPRDLYGIPIDTCARIMSLAAGGQTLMSRFAFDTARPMLRGEELGDLQWLNHGAYQLKGIDEPIEICEVRLAGSPTSPPTSNDKASRLSTEGEHVLGWRPALEQLVPGTRWKLIKKLGEGGFGEVWLGLHEVLREKRVFKFCFQTAMVRSLKRELTLFRILKEKVGEHPNIAAIREVNFDTAPFYIEMDYVAGQDLKAWCEAQGGAAQVTEAIKVEIVAQIADALQAAHECGIVHRDVKPGNLLISKSKSVKATLTDFGIGQVLSEEYLAGMTRAGFTQTMMGSASTSGTGTHLYMAPELLAGKPASARSDLYSLGVVLYQLLIGDFSRAVTIDWARRITDPILRKDLEKCFAGDPQERFETATELARNLRTLDQQRAAFAQREKSATRGRLARRTTVVVALVAAVMLLALFAFKQGGKREPDAPPVKLAVLPLENLSGDVAQQYFADEMTDDLIGKLGQITALRVIGRATVMQFRKPTNSVSEIAEKLNVDAVVRGTLKREKDRLQVEVHLFAARNDRPLWSTNFDLNVRDVFALQNEVTLAIARKMKVKLPADEQARLTKARPVNPEALDLYYRGKAVQRGSSGTNSEEAITTEAIRVFENAVNKDKDFAPARAALAGAYIDRFFWFEPKESRRLEGLAVSELLEAKRLDPNLALAYESHGRLLWSPAKNFLHEAAHEQFQLALKHNPSASGTLILMSYIYGHTGFFDQSLANKEKAAALNPLLKPNIVGLAASYLSKGDYERAITEWNKLDRGNSNSFAGSHWALTLFLKGQTNAAWTKVEEFLRNNPADPAGELTAMKALLFASAGDETAALAWIQAADKKTESYFGDAHHSTYLIACAYARLNKTSDAFQSLKKAAETGFPCYPLFVRDPNLANLRTNLRTNVEFLSFMKGQENDWLRRSNLWFKADQTAGAPTSN